MDREKVIKGLEYCIADEYCDECPYTDDCFAIDDKTYGEQLMRDALELLKEQEAVKPKSKVRHGANAQIQHFCGNCNTMLHGKPKYCSECGKGVLW